jgi:hypothetical protein
VKQQRRWARRCLVEFENSGATTTILDVDATRKQELLKERLAELDALRSPDGAVFKDWYKRTEVTLRSVGGQARDYATEFLNIHYTPMVYPTTDEHIRRSFISGKESMSALLKSALYELEVLSPAATGEPSMFDPELWAHVKELVANSEWEKVASQAAIFLEARLRIWANRPASEHGQTLVSAVLKPDGGVFPLGRTDSEKQAWHLLGMGFFGALSNVVRHRMQSRSDMGPYAYGVLGTASLLLT